VGPVTGPEGGIGILIGPTDLRTVPKAAVLRSAM
jgi:hypothetical protein